MKQICLLMIAVSLAVTMAVAAMARLVEIGHLKGFYSGVVVDGKYAYCAGPKLDVVNVENLANPWVEGSLDSLDSRGIFVYDGFAYIACRGKHFLRIIDISVPSNPASAGSLEMACPTAVSVAYPYACVCNGDLEVVDVHDPCDPIPVGSLWEWRSAMDIHSMSPPMNPYIYATRGYWGGGDFGTIDISDPTNLTVVGNLFISPWPRGIDCEDRYAYVASSSMGSPDEGLVVIDISNPLNPQEVARCHASYALDVSVQGGYAYLTRCHELTVIDVHDPGHPIHVQTIYSPYPEGVFANYNGYTYLADRDHGLSILKFVESPQVSISLVPEVTTVARGDILVYDVTLTNKTNDDQTFCFGALVRRPNGADHVLIEPTKIVLPAQGTKTKRIKHIVLSKIPLGEYVYIAKIGTSPMDIWDEDRFQFEVVDDK
jgi:hypothetical protein